MPARSTQNLLPPGMVELARGSTVKAFADALGAPVLLVRVDEPDGEVARALAEVPPSAGARLVPTAIGFDTVSEGAASSTEARVAGARLVRAPFTAAQAQVRLIRAVHFAAPLRKREKAGKKPFTERISVGRARNNDLVLRHGSVSKFHAWFRCDEEGTFYVGDAGSRNGTLVNGEPLVGSAPVSLFSGDVLQFGSVEAVFCPAELLWEAIR
jgi:hypothetical protein